MHMTDTYQDAIDGKLRSRTTGQAGPLLTFRNQTPMPLDMYWISDEGEHYGWDGDTFAPDAPPCRLEPNGGESMGQAGPELHWYWLFTNPYSGGFATVVRTPGPDGEGGENGGGDGEDYTPTLTGFNLLDPNDIGGFPRPGDGVLLPSDSPRVVVGCGALGNSGNYVVREQYWQRLPTSYQHLR